MAISAEEIRFWRAAHRLMWKQMRGRYPYDGSWWTHPKGLPEARKLKIGPVEEYIEAPDDDEFELDEAPKQSRFRLRKKR